MPVARIGPLKTHRDTSLPEQSLIGYHFPPYARPVRSEYRTLSGRIDRRSSPLQLAYTSASGCVGTASARNVTALKCFLFFSLLHCHSPAASLHLRMPSQHRVQQAPRSQQLGDCGSHSQIALPYTPLYRKGESVQL